MFGVILLGVLPAKADAPYQGADKAIKIETLAQGGSSWDKRPYSAYPSAPPQLSVLKITLPANSVLPWHFHTIPVAAYVLSGKVIIETKSGKKRLFNQGEVLLESMNEIHRGTTGNKPAVLIAFYAGALGIPLATQVQK